MVVSETNAQAGYQDMRTIEDTSCIIIYMNYTSYAYFLLFASYMILFWSSFL